MRYLIFAVALLFAVPTELNAACGPGTISADFRKFHSDAYAGQLAIAPWARNSKEAKNAGPYCILVAEQASVRTRYEKTYFVFNNIVTSSPENREVAFIGVEVRVVSPSPRASLSMRREGESWVRRAIDEKYPATQFVKTDEESAFLLARAHRPTQYVSRRMRTDAWDSSVPILDEDQFAARVDASVHGAVQPKPNGAIRRTWDSRGRMMFVNDLSPGDSVTAVWTSFDQRTSAPLTGRKRVATEVRVGNAREAEIHLFGSNAQIPELNFTVHFQ